MYIRKHKLETIVNCLYNYFIEGNHIIYNGSKITAEIMNVSMLNSIVYLTFFRRQHKYSNYSLKKFC